MLVFSNKNSRKLSGVLLSAGEKLFLKMEGSLFLNSEGGTPRTQFLQTIPWCSRKLVLTGGNISPMSGTPALEMKGNCLLLLTNTKTLSR
ncbi:hypothetical protein NC651_002767 [Populus alba x Populus x berolinensis]|nr:hypothetical protein NC651_002767 [Populus alba x Populus x berolinensis]